MSSMLHTSNVETSHHLQFLVLSHNLEDDKYWKQIYIYSKYIYIYSKYWKQIYIQKHLDAKRSAVQPYLQYDERVFVDFGDDKFSHF